MDLSIVIVNWNTRQPLAGCLQFVQETAGDLALEIFVVDNASADGSAAMVRERFPWVQLIANHENVGFSAANNQAIRQSQSRYVLLLNSDTEVHPGALGTMVRFMNEYPQAGGCGPLLLNADGSLQVSCHPMLTPWREFWRLLFLDRIWRRATYGMSRWNRDTPREVEVIKGACLMLRREALDQVGLLDTRYFMYTEEVDLCHRLGRAGWRLYWTPEARVVHYGGSSTRQAAEAMYIQLYRSKVQFFRKAGGEPQARLFKALLALAYLPRLVVAAAGAAFAPALASRARTFRRLMADMGTM